MTEKTPKTPDAGENGSVSKDKVTVSASTGSDKTSPTPEKPDSRKADRPADTKASATKKPVSASAGAGSGASPKGPASPAVPAGSSPKKPSSVPVVVLSAAVLILAGGLWYQYTTSQQTIEQLQSQVRTGADQARQADQKAQQALDAVNQQRGILTGLQTELQYSKTELDGLSTAFQTITDRGSDLVLLNDIDHLVMIAQQQLQLNGNVANAIISLETAQAQLARANRPALASLQQTINGDLDRLRAATTVDIALLSARLDELAGLLAQAPLLVPDDTVPALESTVTRPEKGGAVAPGHTAPANDTDVWWEKALTRSGQWVSDAAASLRHDLGQFVSVRRVDDAAALLISPDQADRFRDSLRQRIMTAQLALMMDQSLIWETETAALLKAVESRFDSQSAVTRQAIRTARDIADTRIDTPLPDVTNSIRALEAMNEQMGRRMLPEQNGLIEHDGSHQPETVSLPDENADQSAVPVQQADAQVEEQVEEQGDEQLDTQGDEQVDEWVDDQADEQADDQNADTDSVISPDASDTGGDPAEQSGSDEVADEPVAEQG